MGTEVREDLNLGDFFVQPDLRIGYRYDLLNDPMKLKVSFADLGPNVTPPQFTVIGPDPSQGNFVAGGSLSATTDSWTIGANFDYVRGTNGATTEVGPHSPAGPRIPTLRNPDETSPRPLWAWRTTSPAG